MTNIAFVVVLAVIALQSTSAAYLKPRHSILRDGNDIEDLVNEIKKIREDLISRGTKLDQDVDNKFADIEKTVGLSGFFDEMRQTVQKILDDAGSAAEECQSYAWNSIDMLEQFNSVYLCRYFADEDVADLRNNILHLEYRLQELLKELNEDNVVAIKNELEIIDKSIQDSFSKLETSMPVLTTKMTECMNEKKQGLIRMKQNIVDDVQDCIKTFTLPSQKSGPFPDLSDSIKDIESKHNVDKLIKDLTEEVEKLLSTNQEAERLCGPKAHDYVTEFSRETMAEAEMCVMFMNMGQPSTREVLNEFDDCMDRVEDEAYSKQQFIIEWLKDCIQNTEKLY